VIVSTQAWSIFAILTLALVATYSLKFKLMKQPQI